MKRIAALLFVVAAVAAGCAYVPQQLAARYGWTVERVSHTDFRLTSNAQVGDRKLKALAVAGDLAAAAGFRSFIMVADPDRPNSGSRVDWGDSYGGGPGLCTWEIGSSFRIRGYFESSKGKKLWDSQRWAEELNPKRPNKAPEPTTRLVTPRATECVLEMERWNWIRDETRGAPSRVVAHL